ncbi:MAG: 50S ribosomal protein L22 [Candidatus Methanomethylicia archaeon]
MPNWGYALKEMDTETTAIASGRDLNISYKAAYEICKFIRGMKLDEAKEYLEQVVRKEKPIPFTRFKGKVAHHKGMQNYASVRYPVKASKEIIKLLDHVKANAEFKGLDIEKLRIIHISAVKGPKIKRYIERAFGRASPYFKQLVHIEVAVAEEK